MKSIEALYIYDNDSGTLKQILNCQFTRLVFAQGTPQEKEHYFAEIPIKRFRVECSERSCDVYEDQYKNQLVVWLNEVNRDKAIELIGNYILDRIGSEIRSHESFIKRLQVERARAYKLLESLPEV